MGSVESAEYRGARRGDELEGPRTEQDRKVI
jgi:hypothetical protein